MRGWGIWAFALLTVVIVGCGGGSASIGGTNSGGGASGGTTGGNDQALLDAETRKTMIRAARMVRTPSAFANVIPFKNRSGNSVPFGWLKEVRPGRDGDAEGFDEDLNLHWRFTFDPNDDTKSKLELFSDAAMTQVAGTVNFVLTGEFDAFPLVYTATYSVSGGDFLVSGSEIITFDSDVSSRYEGTTSNQFGEQLTYNYTWIDNVNNGSFTLSGSYQLLDAGAKYTGTITTTQNGDVKINWNSPLRIFGTLTVREDLSSSITASTKQDNVSRATAEVDAKGGGQITFSSGPTELVAFDTAQ
ncbi:MAG: hypothetical protein HONBIEJF_01116 [Fimbriimonadaceae bacterium]|nr:hypothetical protein [Fimbriimonadaceae bacterium]